MFDLWGSACVHLGYTFCSYGERGSVIMHLTLYDLFPPASFDPGRIAPLSPAEFISRVLVPETALWLIQEDMQCSYVEAMATLRASGEFGVTMYPEVEVDEEEGAGAQLVMERAQKRRKVIEQEDEIELLLELRRFGSGALQRGRNKRVKRENVRAVGLSTVLP